MVCLPVCEACLSLTGCNLQIPRDCHRECFPEFLPPETVLAGSEGCFSAGLPLQSEPSLPLPGDHHQLRFILRVLCLSKLHPLQLLLCEEHKTGGGVQASSLHLLSPFPAQHFSSLRLSHVCLSIFTVQPQDHARFSPTSYPG